MLRALIEHATTSSPALLDWGGESSLARRARDEDCRERCAVRRRVPARELDSRVANTLGSYLPRPRQDSVTLLQRRGAQTWHKAGRRLSRPDPPRRHMGRLARRPRGQLGSLEYRDAASGTEEQMTTPEDVPQRVGVKGHPVTVRIIVGTCGVAGAQRPAGRGVGAPPRGYRREPSLPGRGAAPNGSSCRL